MKEDSGPVDVRIDYSTWNMYPFEKFSNNVEVTLLVHLLLNNESH